MKRSVVIASNLAGALVALCLAACSGCGGASPKPSQLLPGDAGLCTTTHATRLPDGGYVITETACDFSKGN